MGLWGFGVWGFGLWGLGFRDFRGSGFQVFQPEALAVLGEAVAGGANCLPLQPGAVRSPLEGGVLGFRVQGLGFYLGMFPLFLTAPEWG